MLDEQFGISKDGTRFDDKSPEVIAELEKNPDLNLDVAIGNCIEAQNKISETNESETPVIAE